MNFIVYDLEATCWPGSPPAMRQEIIEIGAFCLRPTGEVVDSFQAFVRPVMHPMLSPFCRELTGITQVQINTADRFPAVQEDLLDFIGFYDDEDYVLCSWGDFDPKQLRRDCRLHKLAEDWVSPTVNLKRQYQRVKGLSKPMGLHRAVNAEGYEWEGEQHRAIDDARNLVTVFRAHIDEWVV